MMSKKVTSNTRQSKAKPTLSTSMLVSPGKADNAQAVDSQASSSQVSTQRAAGAGDNRPPASIESLPGGAIMAKLEQLSAEFGEVRADIFALKNTLTNIEAWMANKDALDNDNGTRLNETEKQVTALHEEVAHLKQQMQTLIRDQSDQHEHTLRLETHSRRDNLVLDGIAEHDGETDRECYEKLCHVLVHTLKIASAREMRITRCHRLGKPQIGRARSRPIIFKLHWYGDRSTIWNARRELKGSQMWLSENFPSEIESRRRMLYPIVRVAREKNIRAHLSVDRAVIAGKIYTLRNLEKLPAELDPRSIATPTHNGITAFFGGMSPLSNFYPTTIRDGDGTVFTSSEQMYQHRKALFFDDDRAAVTIRLAKTPLAAYKAGFNIGGQAQRDWMADKAKQQMFECCLAKFGQNAELKSFLLDTGPNHLVEASKRDRIWGVGIGLKGPSIFDRQQWQGTNWLGDVLERVRAQLS